MAKKSKSPKLPKRIAGVKLPKQLRESPVAVWLYHSDLMRELVTSAIIAGVAALASDETVRSKAGRAADAARKRAAPAKRKAGRVATAASKAARSTPRLLGSPALRRSKRAKGRSGGRSSSR
jgi:hypothetical protein